MRSADVWKSDWDCTLEEAEQGKLKAVRLGFRLVSGLKKDEAKKLIVAREAGATSVEAIARKAGLARGVLERIAHADAFQSQSTDRRAALWRVTGLKGENRIESEAPLLNAAGFAEEEAAELPAMRLSEHVAEDYRTTGLSLKKHPCAFFRRGLHKRGVLRAMDLEHAAPDQRVRVAGLVLNSQRPGTAKNVMFATLEDETGIVNLVVWDQIFQAQRREWMTSGFMLIDGRVQKANGVIHVIADRVHDLTRLLQRLSEEKPQQTGELAVVQEQTRPLQRSRDFH